ncbi:MAG: trigger factor [Firmicutes bacterium]|nr:trigger factor [Bacillota bacterium]
MKKFKTVLALILVIALALVAYFSFFSNKKTDDVSEDASSAAGFNFSDSIDDNGFWKNIRALDYVELCEYVGISIPSNIHEISDESVQTEIDSILAEYASKKQITDRAVVDGDTVNIDYVGSIDGVEFDGGSTEGLGTEVTIGVTSYIDDFLEQLIGHTPGESFDIEVTFPEDYGNEELNGKDAVFAVTLNYIVETITPELTDDFVAENLSSSYGWNTVADMEADIRNSLKSSAVSGYVQEYIMENTTVTSLPNSLLKYQENSLISYYQDYANYYNMDLKEFLNTYVGVSTTEELLEKSLDDNTKTATFYLIVQAIAEDAGISVTDDDVAEYFTEYMKMEDYSEYKEFYGMPYLKLIALNRAVMDYLEDNAIME